MSDGDDRHTVTADMPGTRGRLVYMIVAYVSLGLALSAIVLPLMPALPFLLISIWAASRGSPRVHDWIFEQPQLAEMIRNWREERAVPLYVKWIATLMMCVSWGLLRWQGGHWLLLSAMAILFIGIIIYIWSRPTAVKRAE